MGQAVSLPKNPNCVGCKKSKYVIIVSCILHCLSDGYIQMSLFKFFFRAWAISERSGFFFYKINGTV